MSWSTTKMYSFCQEMQRIFTFWTTWTERSWVTFATFWTRQSFTSTKTLYTYFDLNVHELINSVWVSHVVLFLKINHFDTKISTPFRFDLIYFLFSFLLASSIFSYNFTEYLICMRAYTFQIHLVSKWFYSFLETDIFCYPFDTKRTHTFWTSLTRHSRWSTVSFFSKTFWNTIRSWASTISSWCIWCIDNIISERNM